LNPNDLNLLSRKLPLSAATIARNKSTLVGTFIEKIAEKIPTSKRVRQDSKPLLNKLEAEYLSMISALYPEIIFRAQCLRWRLGNGIFYKPDFVAIGFRGDPMTCIEVKGPHAFRGGFENLKVAASLYPFIKWILVWKENNVWKEQEILP
jgi:hypothetical protein